jgi:serine/threonine protein kinase
MPFPVGAIWAGACRSGQATEAYRGLENVMRLMTALLLADVLDLPWSSELEEIMAGEPDRRGLSRIALGTRQKLIGLLVRAHSEGRTSASPRVLPDLSGWWAEAEPLLGSTVTFRNADIHGVTPSHDSPDVGLESLGAFLRASRWLADVQLVAVETRAQRLGVSQGVVQRLIGSAPFDSVQHRFEASWTPRLSDGLVHMGPRDGRLWVVCPFVQLERRGLALLDGVSRSGKLWFGDPLAVDKSAPRVGLMPTVEGDMPWFTFVGRRHELAEGLRFHEPRPDRRLQLERAPHEVLAAGSLLDADHRLVARIGGGAWADVWEVEDIHSRMRYALKIPRIEVQTPESESRFRREIEMLKRLSAEGVKRVIGPVERLQFQLEGESLTALRMPLFAGTLAQRLVEARDNGKALAPNAILRWGCEALEALAELHVRGLVHRDVKLSNLLLDAEGGVVLADLGQARDLREEVRVTSAPLRKGSPSSPQRTSDLRDLAPEQRVTPGVFTDKTDVYFLARALHELVTNGGAGRPGEGVAAPLGGWLASMASEDPEARPSAREAMAMGRALERNASEVRASVAEGACPSCGDPGVVGAPCTQRVCATRMVCFIPRAHAEKTSNLPTHERDSLTGTFVGDFLVVGRLGRGRFGRVLLGLQKPHFRLRGAVKLLDFEASETWLVAKVNEYFAREAEALSVLHSPNIVRLLQVGEHQGRPCIVMEYIPGGRTVESEIEKAALEGHALPLEAVRRIAEHTANGLEAAHAEGLVHRDIKPANLMLQSVADDPWFVKVVDFGLARVAEGSASTAVAGTLHYMAPEQFDGGELGPWTDLYALGVMAFELLLGRRPFEGERTDVVLAEKRDPGFDPMSRVPMVDVPELVAVFLRKAMHVDSKRRYRTARDFREAWRRVMDSLSRRSALTNDLSALVDLSSPGVRERLRGRLARIDEALSAETLEPSRSELGGTWVKFEGATVVMGPRASGTREEPSLSKSSPSSRRESSHLGGPLVGTSDASAMSEGRPWLWPVVVMVSCGVGLALWIMFGT